jgi:hypothetical protein
LFLNIRQKLFDETKTKKNYNPLNSSPVINEKLKNTWSFGALSWGCN